MFQQKYCNLCGREFLDFGNKDAHANTWRIQVISKSFFDIKKNCLLKK